jgi:hypothetical protein
MKDMITYSEKRFFEWHEDDKSVTLRYKGGSYGGGSEVLVIEIHKPGIPSDGLKDNDSGR